MGRPEHVSNLIQVGMVVELVGLALFIAGFAGAEWSTSSFTHPVLGLPVDAYLGLWEGCNNLSGCTSEDPDDWQIQAAGLQIAALVLYVATTAAVLLYVFVLKAPWVNKVKAIFTATGTISSILIIAGCIIWAENKDEGVAFPGIGMDLAWAFFVALVGGILQAIAAVIFCIDNCI